VLAALGVREVTLYRAAATDGPLPAARPSSLVSATFSRRVADDHFDGGPSTRTAVLWRQAVPFDRVLMTFLETRAMNERFEEAEAVLLADPGNRAFLRSCRAWEPRLRVDRAPRPGPPVVV